MGVFNAKAVCDVNASDPSVTFGGSPTFPPMRCVEYHELGGCARDEYVATFCNLNQYMFNLAIKVRHRMQRVSNGAAIKLRESRESPARHSNGV